MNPAENLPTGIPGLLIYENDGRYAHIPACNDRCGNGSHWLLRGREESNTGTTGDEGA